MLDKYWNVNYVGEVTLDSSPRYAMESGVSLAPVDGVTMHLACAATPRIAPQCGLRVSHTPTSD